MSTPAPSPPSKVGRTLLIWVVKIVVSGGLLYYLFSRPDISGGDVMASIKTASTGWLAAALLIYFIVLLISTWRWQRFLDAQHVNVSFQTLTASYLVATFFNNFLPSNVGGDVIRITDTARAAKSRTLATMIVLVDRGIGLLGLATIAAVGASVTAWFSPTVGAIGPGILWLGVGAAIVATAWAVAMPHGVGTLLKPLRALHQEWVGERIEQLMTALHKFRNSPGTLVSGFAVSMLTQGLLVVFYVAIARALHFEVPLSDLAVVVPLSFIVQMIPASVGGFGAREATFGTMFQSFGLLRQTGLTISLISGALILLFSLSGAVVYLVRTKKH